MRNRNLIHITRTLKMPLKWMQKSYLLLFVLSNLCVFPLTAENNWFIDELEQSFQKSNVEKRRFVKEFKTTVEVSAECEYPYFSGDSALYHHVNKDLQLKAHQVFTGFVEYEQTSQEQYESGFGGCSLVYRLFPVCCLPNLMSICGMESQMRACPHGWTHYEGKNFWQQGNVIREIALKDLFIEGSNWSSFLIKYCDARFKAMKYGYYGTIDDFVPQLIPADLDVFVITTRGLIIIFSSYKVGGWADGPDVLFIPYQDITEFIDFEGPLQEVPEVEKSKNK